MLLLPSRLANGTLLHACMHTQIRPTRCGPGPSLALDTTIMMTNSAVEMFQLWGTEDKYRLVLSIDLFGVSFGLCSL